MLRLEQIIDRWADERPDHPALVYNERRWTYTALRAEMDRRAAMLVAAGLESGETIVTSAIATDDLILTMLACARADLTFFHLSAELAPVERAAFATRADAHLVFTADGSPDSAYPALPRLSLSLPGIASDAAYAEAMQRSACGDADATFSLFITSGTTGATPKIVRQPHRMMTWRHAQSDWRASADHVFYRLHGTFFHPRPIAEMLCHGGTLVLAHPKDPARMEEEIAASGTTALWTNVPFVQTLVEQVTPPPTGLVLRTIRTGGMLMPTSLKHAAARRYGATLLEDYASTEGGSMIGTPPHSAPDGSIGIPYPGVRARLVDEAGTDVPEGATGELIVRTPGMMIGYLDAPEATAQALRDGWFWTGDLARRDANGFYFLEGRRALRINVGGHKVAPEEVEAVLMRHPGVREVVVLAMPDSTRGEVVRAVIVAKGDPPPISALRQFCRERLATYKVPRHWEFRDDLPRSPLGKVLRHHL